MVCQRVLVDTEGLKSPVLLTGGGDDEENADEPLKGKQDFRRTRHAKRAAYGAAAILREAERVTGYAGRIDAARLLFHIGVDQGVPETGEEGGAGRIPAEAKCRTPPGAPAAAALAAAEDLYLVTGEGGPRTCGDTAGLTAAGATVEQVGAAVARLPRDRGWPLGNLHEETLRLIETAAAGNHPLLLEEEVEGEAGGSVPERIGRALTRLLPPLTDEEIAERRISYASCGLEPGRGWLDRRPALRMPHASWDPAVFLSRSDGRGGLQAGEVLLAEHGVLVLRGIEAFALQAVTLATETSSGPGFGTKRAVHPLVVGYQPAGGPALPEEVTERFQLRGRARRAEPGEAGPGEAELRRNVRRARGMQRSRRKPGWRMRWNGQLSEGAAMRFADGHGGAGVGGVRTGRLARTIADVAGSWCIEDEHRKRAAELARTGAAGGGGN